MLNNIIDIYNGSLIVFFSLLNLAYIFLLFVSLFEIRKQKRIVQLGRHQELSRSIVLSGISIIAPAHNEEPTISESIKSLLQLDYPTYEVIVVNDGSTDLTLLVLIQTFSLIRVDKIYRKSIGTKPIRAAYISPSNPKLIVIDKENGGKADALNCGINISSYPYFCAIDADAIIEKDALLRVMRTIQESPENIIAAGGIVRIVNGCTTESGTVSSIKTPNNPWVLWQIIEYLRSYLCGRTGFSAFNGLLIISGAFGIFKKEIVKEIGGYMVDTVGEDMELVVRMHKYMCDQKRPYKIVYTNDPICWTEAPESVTILARQRNRWQRGLIETIYNHKKMIFNPKYKAVGLLAMPYFTFAEMLSPIIEAIGLITSTLFLYFGHIDYQFYLIFLMLTLGFGIFLSWSAILLEEMSFHMYTKNKDIFKLLFFSTIEIFLYRPLHSWWRFKGFIDIIRKKKDWGVMTRKGFSSAQTEEKLLERIGANG